jgi:hypothetical protein
MLLALLFFLSLGEKIVEYRFGYNFGEIFRDFSNNGRHAVNGDSHLTFEKNVKSTDRGVYFNGQRDQVIVFPRNSFVDHDLALAQPFTIVCWSMMEDESGQLIKRFKTNDENNEYFWIKRERNGKRIQFKAKLLGSESGLIEGNKGVRVLGC